MVADRHRPCDGVVDLSVDQVGENVGSASSHEGEVADRHSIAAVDPVLKHKTRIVPQAERGVAVGGTGKLHRDRRSGDPVQPRNPRPLPEYHRREAPNEIAVTDLGTREKSKGTGTRDEVEMADLAHIADGNRLRDDERKSDPGVGVD